MPPPREPDTLSAADIQQLAQLLSRAERRLTRRLARPLEEEGATVEQWRALVLLADGAGHTMSEIAEFALLPSPSNTRLIDRMVADNLVYRKADMRDRRRVLVHVTARGRTLHRHLDRRVERDRDTILVDGVPGDLHQLAACLADLFTAVTHEHSKDTSGGASTYKS